MNCTRCGESGFLNIHQVDQKTLNLFDKNKDREIIERWIIGNDSDVEDCDCCDGSGEHSKDEKFFNCM